jgi:transcriptional regulator with XRE-family HTH domain
LRYVSHPLAKAPENELDTRALASLALKQLGIDLNLRRRRRRIPIATLAARACTTRQTVARIERGDQRVAVGTWAAVLAALELDAPLRDLALRPGRPRLGFEVHDRLLPKRIRRRSDEQ